MHEDADLLALLQEWLCETGAPGVSVALDDGRKIRCHAAGVADIVTQAPVSPHFAFQFGSVTKMVTAFLLIEALADRGLGLETAVVAIAPDLAASNDHAFHHVTVRQLLNHTSGLDSQWWTDMGRGRAARPAAARAIVSQPLIARPGDLFSYSNSGYVLAGYLTEVLNGQAWEDYAESRIARDLGGHSISARAEAILLRPAARGHAAPGSKTGPAVPAVRWYAPAALSPGGGLAGTPTDLARLLRILRSRLEPDPRPAFVPTIGRRHAGWAPGMARYRLGENSFSLGHDGTTAGQACAVRLCEGRCETVIVAANGAWTSAHIGRLADDIMRAVTGIDAPVTAAEPLAGYEDWIVPEDADISGRYDRLNAALTIAPQPEGSILLTERHSPQDALNWFGENAESALDPTPVRLERIACHSYASADRELHFLRHPDAPARLYVHDGMRATPKSTRFWQ